MAQVRSIPGSARQLLVRFAFVLGAAVAGSSCSATSYSWERPPPVREDNGLYANDVFAVRVFGEEELSQDYRIAPDGTIDFPYLGRVPVQGREPTAIADFLREELVGRKVMRTPQVSVFVREINSRQVNVIGQVSRAGSIRWEQNLTIVDTITRAGGFTPIANQREVTLTRRVDNGQRSYSIPVDLIVEGRTGNVLVAPGDIIAVPARVF